MSNPDQAGQQNQGGQQDQKPGQQQQNPGWPAAGRPEARTAGTAEVVATKIMRRSVNALRFIILKQAKR